MGLLGEPIEEYVLQQIKGRQRTSGNGLYLENERTDEDLAVLNSPTTFLKLASGVSVTQDKLKEIGFSELDSNKFSGRKLAENYVLFGGISSFTSGSDGLKQKTNFIGETYEYTKDWGLVPMPGLISADIKALNRGSIKKAIVKFQVHNREQLTILDILYLRLGYTVLLEWGNSIYKHYDNENSNGTLKKVEYTLIDDKKEFFSDTVETSPSKTLKKIEDYRKKYQGNYDALLGKISNFNWSFRGDGSYEVEITIISLGDIIESLSSNIVGDSQLIDVVKKMGTSADESIFNKNKADNIILSLLSIIKSQNSLNGELASQKKLTINDSKTGTGYPGFICKSDDKLVTVSDNVAQMKDGRVGIYTNGTVNYSTPHWLTYEETSNKIPEWNSTPTKNEYYKVKKSSDWGIYISKGGNPGYGENQVLLVKKIEQEASIDNLFFTEFTDWHALIFQFNFEILKIPFSTKPARYDIYRVVNFVKNDNAFVEWNYTSKQYSQGDANLYNDTPSTGPIREWFTAFSSSYDQSTEISFSEVDAYAINPPADAGNNTFPLSSSIKLYNDSTFENFSAKYGYNVIRGSYKEYVAPLASTTISINNPWKTIKGKNEEEGNFDNYIFVLSKLTPFQYYINFRFLLSLLKQKVITRINPSSGSISTPNTGSLESLIDISYEFSPMICLSKQISFDWRKCIVGRTDFEVTGSTRNIFPEIEPWPSGSKDLQVANAMNVYLNFDFIAESITSNTDEKGNISIFSFIKALCIGINESLGGVNNLEPVINENLNQIEIIDTTPNQSSPINSNDIKLNLFGYDLQNPKLATSTFVRKVDLKTAITPEFATMITVGATAGGYVKGIEATSFARWNEGIEDVFKPQLAPADNKIVEKKEEIKDVITNFENSMQLDDECFGISGGGGLLKSFPDS